MKCIPFTVVAVLVCASTIACSDEGGVLSVKLVKDLYPGSGSSTPYTYAAIGEDVLFVAWTSEYGREYWKSDGSEEGTVLIRDIVPGTDSAVTSWGPGFVAVANGVAYFHADDGEVGRELWRTDGTEAGTYLVKDIRPGPESGTQNTVFAGMGGVFFAGTTQAAGREPWYSDGTPAGTRMVKDTTVGPDGAGFGPLVAADSGDFALMLISSKVGSAVWRTDGTPAGTERLTTGPAVPSGASKLTACGDFVFFNSQGLWVSDGTNPGTRQLQPSYCYKMACLDGVLYCMTQDGYYAELWRSDGTPEGTVPLVRIPDLYINMVGGYLWMVGDYLVFTAWNADYGTELWRSDGTPEGTTLVKDCYAGPDSGVGGIHAMLGGVLYLTMQDGIHGTELWRTDATEAGTYMVADIQPGAEGSNPQNFVVAGDKLYFCADNEQYGEEIWVLGDFRLRFLESPHDTTVFEGAPLTIRALANGAETYEWHKDGELISDENGSELHFKSVRLDDAGIYYCIASDGAKASIVSGHAEITVVPKSMLPAAGGWGLTLLSAAIGLLIRPLRKRVASREP